MEVRVRYELVSRSTISTISYNHQFGILALVADGNDTASFFTLGADLSLIPRFSGQSKPPSTGCVSWSPNGLLIAVANIKVQLWKFQMNRMAPLKVINEGFIQIKGIAWTQDSKYYLCYGINPKDSPLSVNVRHIQSNQLRQIITQDPAILANFDPFGKYIAILTLKNSLDLYDARTLGKIRSISFAQTKHDIPTLRDKRLGDWSPQYSLFSCPNLNDSRLYSTLILDRNKNFSCRDILLGHQAPISCVKFNPNVYEYESETTFVLAVGDSSGCLSIWRIGKNNAFKQPLIIASSPGQAEESIEGFEWNSQGDILFANVYKKYVVILNFKIQDFGRKLNEQEKNNLIIATYGASGVNQITNTKFQIFGQHDISIKNENQEKLSKVSIQSRFEQNNKPKQVMIKTEQSTIINKDGNNRQKKRIIPSRFIPQSQYAQKQAMLSSTKPQLITLQQGQTKFLQQPKMPTIKLPQMKEQIKREYYLPDGKVLQVESSKSVYILSLRSSANKFIQAIESKQKRLFNGEIKLITTTNKHILVIHAEKLFVFDMQLKIVELPCYLGEISSFTANNQGTVFFMSTSGMVKGFNYLKHEYILQTSISYLLMSSQYSQIISNPLSMFTVFDQDSDRLHVQLKTSLSRYFFCKQSNSWIQFNFEEGFYSPGHSLRITKQEKTLANNFYMNLVNPAIAVYQNPTNKIQSGTNKFQLQLIYYKKYAKDSIKFKQSLVKMLANLKLQGKDAQLRKQINKYFVDQHSEDYINDRQTWEKVQKIGGKVIQQFSMLQIV